MATDPHRLAGRLGAVAMNEIQHERRRQVGLAKARVHMLERQLNEAREGLRFYENQLEKAIKADPASWHNTPGILK